MSWGLMFCRKQSPSSSRVMTPWVSNVSPKFISLLSVGVVGSSRRRRGGHPRGRCEAIDVEAGGGRRDRVGRDHDAVLEQWRGDAADAVRELLAIEADARGADPLELGFELLAAGDRG